MAEKLIDQVKTNRILSLSGGGVKGMAELVILCEIEERTGKSISELFPVITGTSVGGLIAGLLTIPKESGSKEPKYSAKEAIQIFKDAAPDIFPSNWYDGIKQVIKHKYSQKPIKKLLEEHLDGLRLDDTTSRLIIPVTDLNSKDKGTKLFDSHDSYSPHIKVQDVLLATTAAPTYFKAVSNREQVSGYNNPDDVTYAYADGGLGANRPAYEVLRLLKTGKSREEQTKLLDSTMIVALNFENDIGAKYSIPHSSMDGLVGWLVKGKLVNRLMNDIENKATSEVKSDLPEKHEFTEISIPITDKTQSLDNASLENLEALELIAKEYISNNEVQISQLCEVLMSHVTNEENGILDHKEEADYDTIMNENSIIPKSLESQLAQNLNGDQIATLMKGLQKLNDKESAILQVFFSSLDTTQVSALAEELPNIASGDQSHQAIEELSGLQNKLLEYFSNVLIQENKVETCAKEYQSEVNCDGRGSELSHYVDVM